MPKYRVTMCRIGYRFKTFEVEARPRYETVGVRIPHHQRIDLAQDSPCIVRR